MTYIRLLGYLHDIHFGYFITLVLYSMPLIGCMIYLVYGEYHCIIIGGGGEGQQNITLYHKREGGDLEGANSVS